MSFISIVDSAGVLPAAVVRNSLGVQVDPRNDVWGGQRALFDYSTMPDGVAVGDFIPNMIPGGVPAEVISFPSAGIQVSKGVKRGAAAAEKTNVLLPLNAFDLNAYTSAEDPFPNILIWAWITHNVASSGVNASILGYSYQATGSNQWLLHWQTDGSQRLLVGGSPAGVINTPVINAPQLFCMHVTHPAQSNNWSVRGYINGVDFGGRSASNFPYPNPAGQNGVVGPTFGLSAGFNAGDQSTLHRLGSMRTPDDFVFSDWVAEELTNAPAFVV